MAARLAEAEEVKTSGPYREVSEVKWWRKMDLPAGGFDARHSEHVNNTEVLLALLTQNKELEGLKLNSAPVIYKKKKV